VGANQVACGYRQLAIAENVQHALQIVGGYGQADFRLPSPQSTQQEAWTSEDAVFPAYAGSALA
jgi:hypothetical protein